MKRNAHRADFMARSRAEQPFTVPICDSCDKPALVEQAYSGRVLCGKHLAKSVRKKISKELRMQLPLKKGEHTTVLVAVSGGKDSAVLLDAIVDLIGKRKDVTIVAGTVDEGIEGYRPPSIECAASLCDRLGVEHHVVTILNCRFSKWTRWCSAFQRLLKRTKMRPEWRVPTAVCFVAKASITWRSGWALTSLRWATTSTTWLKPS